MNKLKTMIMAGAALFGAVQAWGATVEVSTWAKLKENLEAGNSVKLTGNIAQGTGAQVALQSGQEVTLDLNGKNIAMTSTARLATIHSASLTIADSAGGGIIDGGNVNRGEARGAFVGMFKIDSVLNITGGTIRNFKNTGYEGGAILVSGGGSAVMSGGTISNCSCTKSDRYGGAVCVVSGSFTMNGGTITGCSAPTGGAIYNAGTANVYGGTITNCTSTGTGGAIYSTDTVVINGGTIIDCKATSGGGAICVYENASATVTVTGGRFINNKATNGWGGFMLGYALNLTGGYFEGCTATKSGNVYMGQDSVTLGKLKGGVFKGADQVSDSWLEKSTVVPLGTAAQSAAQLYVVGTDIAYDPTTTQLTGGTYTFCPTNAEYAAAGVAVKDGKYVLANTTVTPNTWTISDYKIAVDDDSEYEPTQIINGSFDTEPWMTYTYNSTTYTSCPFSGSGCNFTGVTNKKFNGVDGGWNTTEISTYKGNLFEWMKPGHCTTAAQHNPNIPFSDVYVEMNCNNAAVLYQDLTTYGGDVIQWTLKHGVRTTAGDETQSMRVEIGTPKYDSSGKIVNASGVGGEVNSQIQNDSLAIFRNTGVKDSTGATSTIGFAGSNIANLSLSQSSQASGWYSASGVYVIPEGQGVSRFAFISEALTPDVGNLLDDLTFSTLIGNLKALVNDDGSVTITGYWGDSDTSKKLMVKIGDDEADAVDMSGVLNQNFKITVSADKIGDANVLEVYHQDYASAKRTVTIGYAVTLNLNADDATCAKLETYQRGAVTVLPIPTRTGYSFKGWFENAELTGAAVTQIEATATGAKTFYAKWQGPLIQVGDDAWAWVTNGLCEITGTTATWDFTTTANPLDSYSRAITNIVVCDGVTELGAYTFYKFYYATNITFAASVTNLCAGALFRCLSFENVTFEGTLPNMEDDNALVIHAGIKMEGGKPVVYAVPNVTVNGQSLILKGSNDLKNWENVTSGNEKNYHFFKFVAE